MFLSPLQELPILGRNTVYIGSLFIFVLFQLPIAVAKNFSTVLAFRFLTGFFGSPALATGVSALPRFSSRSRKLMYLIGCVDGGHLAHASVSVRHGRLGVRRNGRVSASQNTSYEPLLKATFQTNNRCLPNINSREDDKLTGHNFPGPVIGGFPAQGEGWRWPIYELIWISGFALAFLALLLPETYEPTILLRRAARLRKLTGNPHLRSQSEIDAASTKASERLYEALVRPFVLAAEPTLLFANVYLGFVCEFCTQLSKHLRDFGC